MLQKWFNVFQCQILHTELNFIFLKTIEFLDFFWNESYTCAYHENGVDAFDLAHVTRQGMIAHVTHETEEALDREGAHLVVESQQATLYRDGRKFNKIHLFLPRPLGTVLLIFAFFALFLALQGLDYLQRSIDRAIGRAKQLEPSKTRTKRNEKSFGFFLNKELTQFANSFFSIISFNIVAGHRSFFFAIKI